MEGTMDIRYTEYARLFSAIADPNRLMILSVLTDGETFADNILTHLDISQPTLSHHMKALCEAEIVVARKDGRRVFYSINEDMREKLLDNMLDILYKDDEGKASVIAKRKARRKTDIVLL